MTGGLLLGALLLAAGCGTHPNNNGIASVSGTGRPSANPSPVSSEDRQQQAVDFAKCMRAHGINMDDPSTTGGGMQIKIPQGTSREKVATAQAACKHFLPNGGNPPSLSPEQMEKARRYAQCMRDHGVNMPDPDPNNPGMRIAGGGPKDPKVKAAMDACQSLNPMGPPPGGQK